MEPLVDPLRSPAPPPQAACADGGALPPSDDLPEDRAAEGEVLDVPVVGIDVTGATISQEWPPPAASPSADGECVAWQHVAPPPRPPVALTAPAAALPPAGAPPPPRKDAPSILLPHQSDYVSHIALDIGGSLIKLVYFSKDQGGPRPAAGHPGGKLHFVKFETAKVDECIDFIEAKGLHRRNGSGAPMRVKATGGGAFKYAEAFRRRLGLVLEREDEMACMVDGCNFLLKAVAHEAFTYENGAMGCVDLDSDPAGAFPYLLVNIGSGVSMVRVDGEGRHTRVSGTNIGGGTFWGLCRLLTGLHSFDDILRLSTGGDNSAVDMLVGDIYGGRDYTAIGLSANTIASSFGKVVYGDRELGDYSPADVAMSLCRMISYNIGQLAYLNAKRYSLSRIFFGGFFIRGHPYTMETISFAIRFWSKGEMGAMFLRHEGFLGAVGAFMRVQEELAPLQGAADKAAGKVRARFVERFSMGAPVMGGAVRGPAMHTVTDKITWVEKFIEVGRPATEAARSEHERAQAAVGDLQARGLLRSRTFSGGDLGEGGGGGAPRIDLHVGVLHFDPSSEPFPLLADPLAYHANTIDINADPAEMDYWVGVLQRQIPNVVEKVRPPPVRWRCAGLFDALDAHSARVQRNRSLPPPYPSTPSQAASSEGNAPEAVRRAAAFGRALDLHLTTLRAEPGAYGQLGLADLFELRECTGVRCSWVPAYLHANMFTHARMRRAAGEECLREFGFADVYRVDKERENAAALEVLPDLLAELDGLPPGERLAAAVHGALAANIFDWGAQACVELYHDATITQMYRRARENLAARPWRVDDLDEFCGAVEVGRGYKRAVVFVDNAGADVVLGMLPLARELLRAGAEVVLVANSLPAINDVTAAELRGVVARAAEACPVIRAARDAAVAAEAASQGRVPPLPGLSQRVASSDRLATLGGGGAGVGGGSGSGSGSGGHPAPASPTRLRPSQLLPPMLQTAAAPLPASIPEAGSPQGAAGAADAPSSSAAAAAAPSSSPPGAGAGAGLGRRPSLSPKGMFGESYPSPWRDPRLYIVASGHGSPCLDLRRVSSDVADATVGADLVVIEGMGRAVHTNYTARFKCDVLKLAMIKNQHLAQRLFGGDVYDCVCRFDQGQPY
jgi:type II pantothenate kinase